MIFSETRIRGAYVIVPEPHVDARGSFARLFCARDFEAHGLDATVAQISLSMNPRRATLRGMHYSVPPHAEAKVVRCVRGAVYDVLLDVREGSASFGVWIAEELSARNGVALYVPAGVAHGFQTLEDGSDVLYQMNEFYDPACARGVRFDDPAFRIEWPSADRIMSDRDGSYTDYGRERPIAE